MVAEVAGGECGGTVNLNAASVPRIVARECPTTAEFLNRPAGKWRKWSSCLWFGGGGFRGGFRTNSLSRADLRLFVVSGSCGMINNVCAREVARVDAST